MIGIPRIEVLTFGVIAGHTTVAVGKPVFWIYEATPALRTLRRCLLEWSRKEHCSVQYYCRGPRELSQYSSISESLHRIRSESYGRLKVVLQGWRNTSVHCGSHYGLVADGCPSYIYPKVCEVEQEKILMGRIGGNGSSLDSSIEKILPKCSLHNNSNAYVVAIHHWWSTPSKGSLPLRFSSDWISACTRTLICPLRRNLAAVRTVHTYTSTLQIWMDK